MRNMSINNVKLIGILSIAIIVAICYFLLYSPLNAKKAEQQQSLESAKSNLSVAEKSLTETQRFNELYPQVSAIAQDIQVRFPSSADVDALNSSVALAAAQSGLSAQNVTSITTGSPTLINSNSEDPSGTTMAEMTVGISVDGPRENLVQFLDNLSKMNRVIIVKSANITVGETSNLSISGMSYLYKPVIDPILASDQAQETPTEQAPPTEPETENAPAN